MSVEPRFVGATELPWEAGTHRGPDTHDAGSGYDSQIWTLTGITKEFALYTPVVLSAAGLDFDPVHLCWEENRLPPNELPYAVESPVPLLAGLSALFNRTVFACPLDHAPTLFRFLDRMSMRAGGTVYDSIRQQVDVVDWVMLHRLSVAPPRPPLVSMALYGVQGADTVYCWVPPKNPWKDRFQLVRRDIKPRTAKS